MDERGVYVLGMIGLCAWDGVDRVVWLVSTAWFSLVGMRALFWSVIRSVMMRCGEVKPSRQFPRISECVGR